MPRLTAEQVRRLRELAGMPDAEASVEVILAAVEARLAERNRQLASPARRDQVIEAAIAAGKFTEARRAHYRAQWDQDPAGTAATIASLAAVAPLAAASSSAAELDEFSGLWPPDMSARPDFRPVTAAEREHMLAGPSREQHWARQDAAMAAADHPGQGLSDAAYEALFGEDN